MLSGEYTRHLNEARDIKDSVSKKGTHARIDFLDFEI